MFGSSQQPTDRTAMGLQQSPCLCWRKETFLTPLTSLGQRALRTALQVASSVQLSTSRVFSEAS
jgi:hypothetical protein